MARIVRLEAENFKRLVAVELRPQGNTVVIGGDNGAGKTSILDAIESVLGGARRTPQKPIRNGSKRSRVVAELDSGITVRRVITKKTNQLVVEDKGETVRSPQTILDSLLGDLTFDPLEFSRMAPDREGEVVKPDPKAQQLPGMEQDHA